ncbi:MAG TPA: helix-turn-helix transcriptional regulator [Candidatus Acidoferrales bacterium]|nr:helix-turn-helix transcriptional regulator [Candidatus Acidoferrales bacterium]
MNVDGHDASVSLIASAIGEPARARMLFCLSDGRARTSTELAVVAEVSPSTASSHLQRLRMQKLVKVFAQGKHHYYSLEGPNVAAALEALSVLAGRQWDEFVPSTPNILRAARTCYDHIAGALGVSLHDSFTTQGWLTAVFRADHAYDATPKGEKGFGALGIDIEAARALRRRLAFACVDWSERRPHLGGALGSAVLKVALQRKWVLRDTDGRALEITPYGRREMQARFKIRI